METLSTIGLILVAVGLVAPFATLDNPTAIAIFRWIFSAGALIYTAARIVNVNAPSDSPRLRRLRRMEMWAGFCFIVAAGCWFYNAAKNPGIMMSLPMMNETVVFTLAGAMIQIVASWLISSQVRKEQKK